MCGNHQSRRRKPFRSIGSPPRVREPLKGLACVYALAGITPACAGTTTTSASVPLHSQDHPRVCGNHDVPSVSLTAIVGSPPRVREPHTKGGIRMLVYGITPACAGTTRLIVWAVKLDEDHPRVCGNHISTKRSSRSLMGSPPRVREPLGLHRHIDLCLRITPACAGTTSRADAHTLMYWDHPRVCGNHGSGELYCKT